MNDIKKIQIKLLEIKITMCDMKNTLGGINGRSGTTEEKISELEPQN